MVEQRVQKDMSTQSQASFIFQALQNFSELTH